MLFFTSDHHFGHPNIIGYCGRPHGDVDAMDRALEEAWNDTVGPDDEVWHLGDVVMGERERTLQVVQRLHGRKILLAGNHDNCWWGYRQKKGYDYWRQLYRDMGFARIIDDRTTMELAGNTVLLCHFPYRNDGPNDEKYSQQRPTDTGDWLLHGHVHERWRQRGRMINVGVDAWEFRPVAASEIEALIAAGAADIPADAALAEPADAPLAEPAAAAAR